MEVIRQSWKCRMVGRQRAFCCRRIALGPPLIWDGCYILLIWIILVLAKQYRPILYHELVEETPRGEMFRKRCTYLSCLPDPVLAVVDSLSPNGVQLLSPFPCIWDYQLTDARFCSDWARSFLGVSLSPI